MWIDPRAIRQICLNLLSNALKFTPKGGRITITVAPAPDGGQLLSVRDTGPGIPEDEIPKVMMAFGQGSLAHETAEGGTGLGLPIVKSLIELHGGTFQLNSELRKGTEVVVTIPRPRVLSTVAPLQPLGAERHRRVEPSQDQARPQAQQAAEEFSGVSQVSRNSPRPARIRTTTPVQPARSIPARAAQP
jgi:two-component system cell cycle sensor histidine kinase PleC